MVTLHIQWIITWSLRCRRCKSDEAGAQVSLTWSMALLAQKFQSLPLEVMMGNEREVRTCRSLLNLPHVTRHLVMEEKFTTTRGQAVPKVIEGWHHLRLLCAHCNLCRWSAIYWSGLPLTPYTPKAGIRLQKTRDTTAFLVNPTGTTTTENGVCAYALETHATGVLPRLLKYI